MQREWICQIQYVHHEVNSSVDWMTLYVSQGSLNYYEIMDL